MQYATNTKESTDETDRTDVDDVEVRCNRCDEPATGQHGREPLCEKHHLLVIGEQLGDLDV